MSSRHADLNWHLTLIKVKSEALCPLCQEKEETSLHFLGRCSILGSYLMDYSDIANLYCSTLVKFTKRLL